MGVWSVKMRTGQKFLLAMWFVVVSIAGKLEKKVKFHFVSASYCQLLTVHGESGQTGLSVQEIVA